MIWFTILEIGKNQNKDVVFVSGEEKPDWFYKSAGSTLYPRFELVNEFKEHSQNHSFYILEFSEFLGLAGADKEVIKEIEEEEIKIQSYFYGAKFPNFYKKAKIAVHDWLKGLYIEEHGINITMNDRGFPNIEIMGERRKIGVVIKDFLTHIKRNKSDIPLLIVSGFRDVLYRAYYESKKHNFTEFIFVLVLSSNPEFPVTLIKTKVNTLLEEINSENFTTHFYIGYLSQEQFIVL